MQFLFIDPFTKNSRASRQENNVVEVSDSKLTREPKTKTKTCDPKEQNTCEAQPNRYSSRTIANNTPNKTALQLLIALQVESLRQKKKKQRAAVLQQESKAKDNNNSIIIFTALEILLVCTTSKKLTNLSRKIIKSTAYVRLAQLQHVNYCYSY